MSDQLKPRRSARVILRDGAGRVLLLHFNVRRGDAPFRFWATPGGSVETTESDLDAGRREMRGELGITNALSGPVHSTTNQFEHEGVLVENTDVFFFGHCKENAPALGAVNDAEREAITTM